VQLQILAENLSAISEMKQQVDALRQSVAQFQSAATSTSAPVFQGLKASLGEIQKQIGALGATFNELFDGLNGKGGAAAASMAQKFVKLNLAIEESIGQISAAYDSQISASNEAARIEAANIEKTTALFRATMDERMALTREASALMASIYGGGGQFGGFMAGAPSAEEAYMKRGMGSGRTLSAAEATVPMGMYGGMVNNEAQAAQMAAQQEKIIASEKAAQEAMSNLGMEWRNVGRKVVSWGYSATISGGILAMVLGAGVKSAAEMDDSLRRMATAFPGAADQAEKFRDDVTKLAQKAGVPMEDVIAGAYKFTSSMPEGLRANNDQDRAYLDKMFETYIKTMLVAQGRGEQITPEEAAYNMNAAISQFYPGKSLAETQRNYQHVSDTFTNIALSTASEIGKAGESFKAFGPLAHSLGLSFDQVAEMVASLAQVKVTGTNAGQTLKRMFARQAQDPKAMQAVENALESEGVSASMYDKSGRMRDPYEVLASLGKAIEAMNAEGKQKEAAHVLATLGGLWAIPNLAALTTKAAQIGPAGMQREQERMTASGSTDKAYEARINDIERKAIDLENKVKAAWLSLFKQIEPDLSKAIDGIGRFIDWFMALPEPIKKAAVEAALFGTALSLVMGPIAIVGGSLVKMVGIAIEIGPMFAKAEEATSGFFAKMGVANAVTGKMEYSLAGVARSLGGPFISAWNIVRTAVVGVTDVLVGLIGIWPLIIGAVVAGAALIVTHWQQVTGFFGRLSYYVHKGLDEAGAAIQRWAADVLKWFQGITPDLETWGKTTLKIVLDALFNPVAWFNDIKTLGENIGKWWQQSVVPVFAKMGKEGHEAFDAAYQQAARDDAQAAGKSYWEAHEHLLHQQTSSFQRNIYKQYGVGGAAKSQTDSGFNSPDSGEVDQNPDYAAAGDAIENLMNSSKAKKAKTVYDAVMAIKESAIKGIIDFVKAVEAEQKKQGRVIHNGWIDMITPGGQNIPIWGNKADIVAAEQHLAAVAAAAKKDQELLKSALKMDATDTASGAALADMFNKAGEAADTFDRKLQLLTDERKNKEYPTIQELAHEYNMELSYRHQLSDEIDQETKKRSELNDQVYALGIKIKELQDAGLGQTKQCQDLIALYTQLDGQLKQTNVDLDNQKDKLVNLQHTIQDTGVQIDQLRIKQAKWGVDLDQSLRNAGKAATDAIGGEFDAFITQVMTRLHMSTGIVGTFVRTFVQKFLQSEVAALFDSLSNNVGGFFQQAFGKQGIHETDAQLNHENAILLKSAVTDLKASTEKVKEVHINDILHAHQTAADHHRQAAAKLVDAANAIIKAEQQNNQQNTQGVQVASASATDNLGPVGSSASSLDSIDSSLQYVLNQMQSNGDALPTVAQDGSGNNISGGYTGIASEPAGLTDSAQSYYNQMNGIAAYEKNFAIGDTVGQLVAGMVNGGSGGSNSTWATVGSAIGSLFGPVGGAIGGALGGLFGNNSPASYRPDQTMPGYQQYLQTYNMAGGQIQQMEGILAGLNGNFSGYTASQQSILKQLQALGPNLGIASEKNGVFTLGSGKHVGVAEYIQLTEAADKILQSAMNDQLQQAQNADRLAASFTTMLLGGTAGLNIPYFLQGGNAGYNHLAGGYVPGSTVPTAPSTPGGPPAQMTPFVTVNLFPNSTLSETSVEELRAQIPELANILTNAMNASSFASARLRGDFVSTLT